MLFLLSSRTLLRFARNTHVEAIAECCFWFKYKEIFFCCFLSLIFHRVFAFDCLYVFFDFHSYLLPPHHALGEYIFECDFSYRSRNLTTLSLDGVRLNFHISLVSDCCHWAVIYATILSTFQWHLLGLSFSLSLGLWFDGKNPDRWQKCFTKIKTVHVWFLLSYTIRASLFKQSWQ